MIQPLKIIIYCEVAYLSLPPNESAKSNKVSTTTGNWDGRWLIENLEEISNIEGAYGIFTSFKYRIDKTYILAVKKIEG